MKTQLYIYVAIIVLFIAYNQFFAVEDERMNTIINILFGSFIFLYMGYLAYVALQKMKKASKK